MAKTMEKSARRNKVSAEPVITETPSIPQTKNQPPRKRDRARATAYERERRAKKRAQKATEEPAATKGQAPAVPRQKLAPWHKRNPEKARGHRRKADRVYKTKLKAQRIVEAEQELAAALERLREADQLDEPDRLSSATPEYKVAKAEIAALRIAAKGEADAAAKNLHRITARSGRLPA